MVLNNGFCEMSQDEIMLLEGGGVLIDCQDEIFEHHRAESRH